MRGKANAEVEFGNKLTLVENRVGVIMDYWAIRRTAVRLQACCGSEAGDCDNEGVGETGGLSVRTMRHSWPSTTSRAVYARATQMNCTVG